MLDVEGFGRAGRLRPVLGLVLCTVCSSAAWGDWIALRDDCDKLNDVVKSVVNCSEDKYGGKGTRDAALKRVEDKLKELCKDPYDGFPECDVYQGESRVAPRERAMRSGDKELIKVLEAGCGN